MKIFDDSDLSNNRSEVLEEAAKNGVIIQEKATNGRVRREFALISNDEYRLYAAIKYDSDRLLDEMESDLNEFMKRNGELLGITREEAQKIYNASLTETCNAMKVAPQRYSFDKQSVSESEFMAAQTRMALEQKVTK